MRKKNIDIEDLIVFLECARENLMLIHDDLEDRDGDLDRPMQALYSTYIHLGWIADTMSKQVGKIGISVIRKASEEAVK